MKRISKNFCDIMVYAIRYVMSGMVYRQFVYVLELVEHPVTSLCYKLP